MTVLDDSLTYAEAQSKVQFEHTLISHRMSWLFTAQGFLIAAFFVLVTSGSNVDATQASEPNETIGHFQNVIIALGFFISLSIYLGVVAAHMAMAKWKKQCEETKSKFLLSDRMIHSLGEMASSAISSAFIFIWIDIFLVLNKVIDPRSGGHFFVIFVYIVITGWVYQAVIKAKFSGVSSSSAATASSSD